MLPSRTPVFGMASSGLLDAWDELKVQVCVMEVCDFRMCLSRLDSLPVQTTTFLWREGAAVALHTGRQ